MPLAAPLSGFFTEEYERFKSGLAGLDPRVSSAIILIEASRMRRPGEQSTINIPGWDQVIKLGPRVEVSKEQWAAYYKAKRTGGDSGLPQEVLDEIGWKLLVKEARRTSGQPDWMKSWGQIMTAIDNVQDFLSTLATLGRLAIWAGSRIGLRAIPGLGWIILASDLLNLMNFLGLVAMPIYGLLCSGPRDALAAGVPAMVLKNALCREVWTMTKLNPFSREARALRKLKALGKLPSVGNLIEVLQTTDNLFGYGLAIGPLYGAFLEAIFAPPSLGGGAGGKINTDLFGASIGMKTFQRAGSLNPADGFVLRQAGAVLRSAPMIASASDIFPDHVHLSQMVALVAAVGEAHKFFDHPDVDDWLPSALAGSFPAPAQIGPTAAAILEHDDDGNSGIGTWPLPGNPEWATGAQIIEGFAPQITRALRDYLEPRRNRRDAGFYGALVTQFTENMWYMIERDPEVFRFELAPDMKLATGLASDGLLIPSNADQGAAWRFWQAMRRELDRRGGKLLDASKVWQLAHQADVPLMRLLAPDAPLPMEWAPFFAGVDPAAAAAATACPTCGKPHG